MKAFLLTFFLIVNTIIPDENIDVNFDTAIVGSRSTGWTINYKDYGNSGTSKVWDDNVELYDTPELVAYYPFNGNANDESGNANNGTVNGASLTTDRYGIADRAYYFDGVDDYISVLDNANINIADGESYSISLWVKHDAQNNSKYILSKYYGSIGVEPSYAVGTGNDGDSYSWFEFTPGNGVENRGDIDLNDNQWHNFTTVYRSGQSIDIYIDGVLDVSNNISYTGSIVNTRDLTIGCGANISQFYKGSIDDIKIYNYALSEEEVAAEVSQLIAYYPFNGNADDESGNANNGTVNGASLTTDRYGVADKAYYFDGVDDYIECLTEVGPFGSNSRTISFWAKTDVDPDAGNQQNTVLSYGGNIYDGGSRFEILLNPKCRGLGVDVSSKYKTKDFDNSDNDWHFYTIVFDNSISTNLSDIKYYADGELLTSICNSNSGDITINTLDEQVLNIGRLFYTGQPRYFRGSIDEIKIYNYALSDAEVSAEFPNLLAYYPFNGNADDYSGKLHHGSVYGATLTQDKDGNTDSAYYFDGIDDYIDIGDWENGGSMSFTFWARWDVLNLWSRILDLGNGADDDNIIISNRFTSDEFFFGVYNTDIYEGVYTTSITTAQWDFYTATVDDNGVMTIYKNAAQIAQNTDGYTPIYLLRTNQYIGKSNFSSDGYFKGAIDDLRIFGKTLSQQEITDLYNAGTLTVNNSDFIDKMIYVYDKVLYIKSDANTYKQLHLYNTFGQEVYHINTVVFPLNLDFLKTGIYLIELQDRNNIITRKKILIY